ncbi:hypothetical protein DMX09_11145 [Pseudomonas protegens]|uniref:anti-phage protein KwaB n=1 Tax=Pseudomonas protegens TaxID=380021 RepID=UPI000D8F6125|nr:anti-phage protein KwaB [Pseudomonas protegens]PYC05718.1 hypothetical protein DMX09_11145 [Pseudomonas protegens]
MTIENIKKTVAHIKNSNTTNAVLYLLLKVDKKYTIKKADLEQKAQNELTEKEKLELDEPFLLDDLKIKDLTTSDERRNVIHLYNLEPIPEELSYLLQVLNPGHHVENFDKKSDSLNNLKAMIIAIGDEKKRSSIYKFHFPTNTYHTKGLSIFNAKTGTSRFEKLEQEIVRVSNGYDFISIENKIYVTNIKILERFFGYHESIKKSASENLKKLEVRGLIENIKLLEDRIKKVGDMTFSRKVIRALSHSPVIEKVTNEGILKFVEQHHLLGKKIKLNPEKTKMILDTKTSQNFFMKLLNDDYLKSELTELEYEAASKDFVTDVEEKGA